MAQHVRRLGILGGTFDPPHIGHVVAASFVRHALGLDEVWFVVANQPWQKAGQPVSAAADRYAMVEAAIDGIPGLVASRRELERGGDSYTADTVGELRAEDPDRELFVIVGADAAAGLPTWERGEEVRAAATMVVVDRPGVPAGALPAGWTFERVAIPRLDVSSTGLRARVAADQPIDGLVPAGVGTVIRDRFLYHEAPV
jgi:nicotinate-nucleotide adenylyltransferase